MFARSTECALQASIYLALHSGEGSPVRSEEIARQLELPHAFTRKCLRDLVEAGILKSRKGRTGGFVLAGPPSEISVLDIVVALQTLRRYEACLLGQPECPGEVACPLHDFWMRLIERFEERLGRTSLRRMAKDLAGAARYRKARA